MAIERRFVLVLYGSHARGEADECSDRDVLLVTDDDSIEKYFGDTGDLSLSRYRWPEFYTMFRYGSLFLRHLRMEGRVLGGDKDSIYDYQQALKALPPYSKAQDNIRSFRLALDDVASAIAHRDSDPSFEAAALASLLRHSAILGCYLIGEMDFGRYSAVTRFCGRRELPNEIAHEYPMLYRHRLAYGNPCVTSQDIDYRAVETWLLRARAFVEETANVSVPQVHRSAR